MATSPSKGGCEVPAHFGGLVRTHDDLLDEAIERGQLHSIAMRVGVFYGLLYVVVEGYQDLKYQDSAIDALLKKTHYTAALRRFRNATFHFQEDPFSPKLSEFLEAKDSEVWAKQLHVAFKTFFEKNSAYPRSSQLARFRMDSSTMKLPQKDNRGKTNCPTE